MLTNCCPPSPNSCHGCWTCFFGRMLCVCSRWLLATVVQQTKRVTDLHFFAFFARNIFPNFAQVMDEDKGRFTVAGHEDDEVFQNGMWARILSSLCDPGCVHLDTTACKRVCHQNGSWVGSPHPRSKHSHPSLSFPLLCNKQKAALLHTKSAQHRRPLRP